VGGYRVVGGFLSGWADTGSWAAFWAGGRIPGRGRLSEQAGGYRVAGRL